MGKDEQKDRCGFTLGPRDTPVDVRYTDADKWYEKSRGVCCWRKTWDQVDSGRCIWHADVNSKPIEELSNSIHEKDERIYGAHLCDVEAEDDLSLVNMSLLGSDLSGSNFREANFSGSKFNFADLAGSDFRNANLSNTIFQKTNFSETDLFSANLSGSSIRDAKLVNTSLQNINLSNGEVSQVDFQDVDLSYADLRNVDFSRTEISGVNLTNTIFTDDNVFQCEIRRSLLKYTDFSDVYPIIGFLIFLLNRHYKGIDLIDRNDGFEVLIGKQHDHQDIVKVLEKTSKKPAVLKYKEKVGEGDERGQGFSIEIKEGEIKGLQQVLTELIDTGTTNFLQKDLDISDTLKHLNTKLNTFDSNRSGEILKNMVEAIARLSDNINERDISPNTSGEDVIKAESMINQLKVENAINELEEMIDNKEKESKYQAFFEKYPWFFGNQYVGYYQRSISPDDEVDIALISLNNYLDIIELKRPEADIIKDDDISHNGVPQADLMEAIVQVQNYIQSAERMGPYHTRENEEEENNEILLKPRGKLVIGSNLSTTEHKCLRVINSHLTQVEILTFTDLLKRGRRMRDYYQKDIVY